MAGPGLHEQLDSELADWRAAGLERALRPPAGRDFTSNDYLGLSRDPEVVEAAREALETYGAGSPSARLLRGQLAVHEAVEAAAADWLGADAALLFPSGFQANQAVLSTLADAPEDRVFSARSNHASLVEGCRLARARVEVFPLEDLDRLADGLRAAGSARRRILAVESVDSMDGRRAPLGELHELARRHDAWLHVDEAHAAGVFGPEGAGCVAELPERERVISRLVTGGKALGVAGGLVVADRSVCAKVLQRARAFVYTTAVAPAVAGALSAAIGRVRTDPELRERLAGNVARLRRALRALDPSDRHEGPIQPWQVGDPAAAVALQAGLAERGFDLRAVRAPTVPAGSERLRIVCRADHRPEDLDALVAAIGELDAGARDRVVRARASRPARTRPVVVAGTDTGVGKTVVSALLLRAAQGLGRRARYWKPVQTGDDCDTATVRALGGLAEEWTAQPAWRFALPASVDQAAQVEGLRADLDRVLRKGRTLLGVLPEAAWIWECAGGLLVPFNEVELQIDWMERLRAPVVLVARSGLGTLNHTLLSVEALRGRGIPLRGVVLVGPRHAPNERSLRARLGPTPLLAVPRFEPLDSPELDRWIDAADADTRATLELLLAP